MKQIKQALRDHRGLTLLETVLGMALFALAITLLSTMLATSARISRESYRAQEQGDAAQAALELRDPSARTTQTIWVSVKVRDGFDFDWPLVLETYRPSAGGAAVRAFADPDA